VHSTTRDVAGPQYEIGLVIDDRLEQSREVVGVMCQVGIHERHGVERRMRFGQGGCNAGAQSSCEALIVPVYDRPKKRVARFGVGEACAGAIATSVVHGERDEIDRESRTNPGHSLQ
jgi:hypothetical protein